VFDLEKQKQHLQEDKEHLQEDNKHLQEVANDTANCIKVSIFSSAQASCLQLPVRVCVFVCLSVCLSVSVCACVMADDVTVCFL